MDNLDWRKVGAAGLVVLLLIIGIVFGIRTFGGEGTKGVEETTVEINPYLNEEEGADYGKSTMKDSFGELSNGMYVVDYQEEAMYDLGIPINRFETNESRLSIAGIDSEAPIVLVRYSKRAELGNVATMEIASAWESLKP